MPGRIVIELSDEEDVARAHIDAEELTSLELRALIGELEVVKSSLIEILRRDIIEVTHLDRPDSDDD